MNLLTTYTNTLAALLGLDARSVYFVPCGDRLDVWVSGEVSYKIDTIIEGISRRLGR